jgi:hypothetical protein
LELSKYNADIVNIKSNFLHQKGWYDMKKMQFVLIVLAVLAMLANIAAAPLAISLIQVRNDAGGGAVFVFRVNGQFSPAQLKGTVHVNGEDINFPLYCVQKDETTVQCTTSRNAGGNHVVVTFGGSKFWTDVPEAAAPQYCYNVYDDSSARYGRSFYLLTSYCQDTPALYNDMIKLDIVNHGVFDIYTFSHGANPINEDAYFYLAR